MMMQTPSKDLESIASYGIVGAGGAGFPSHVKLAAQPHPEILIVNAAECEPLLHKDAEIIKNHVDLLFAGCRKAAELCGAAKIVFGIKKKRAEQCAILKANCSSGTSVVLLDDFYPAGDEVTLVYKTTGRVVQPGTLPVSCGCVVQNVETLYNIGLDKPVTRKFLSIAGAVEKPVTLNVPIGMSVRELLSNVGITVKNHAVVANGVMMGYVEDNPDAVVTKRSGGYIILPSDHYVVRTLIRSRSDDKVKMLAKSACDQCSYCTELCPRYLLGHPVRPEISMRNRMFSLDATGKANPGSVFCCDCNLCTLYACPEGLDPRGACRIEKSIIREQKISTAPSAAIPHPMLRYRATPTNRLKARLGLSGFVDAAPLAELKKSPSKVVIMLSQHVGAPATPCVKTGDAVKEGDCIGTASGNISATVHASINGRVTAVNKASIVIEA
jgi:Na+-translocating ferredoxin:NAD+ oxidoreductase RnfC subunit